MTTWTAKPKASLPVREAQLLIGGGYYLNIGGGFYLIIQPANNGFIWSSKVRN